MSDLDLLTAIYLGGGAVTRPGCYDVNYEQALKCAELVRAGDSRAFVKLDKATHSLWDLVGADEIYLDENEYKELVGIFNNPDFREIVDYPEDYLEKIKRQHDRYLRYMSYKERRKRANSAISCPKIRSQVFAKSAGKCTSCGSEENLSVDHIKSVFEGGSNDVSNLQALCISCNSRKGA